MKKLLVTLLVASLLTTVALANRNTEPECFIYYEVQQGDTLWDIACKNCTDKQNKQDYIYEVEQLNNIQNCDIKPYQVIRLPYEKEAE